MRGCDIGLMHCIRCGAVARLGEDRSHQPNCPRCHAKVSLRKPDSLLLTWMLLVLATIVMVPANVLPIMTVMSFGTEYTETIMSGIIHLMQEDLFVIAFLIFVASIVVPVFKLIGLGVICLAVQYRWPIDSRQAKAMFGFIKFIGRWSMLDLFMISILMGLVNMGTTASVETGAAATAFTSVVVLTMMAANAFDQRLIWDAVS